MGRVAIKRHAPRNRIKIWHLEKYQRDFLRFAKTEELMKKHGVLLDNVLGMTAKEIRKSFPGEPILVIDRLVTLALSLRK